MYLKNIHKVAYLTLIIMPVLCVIYSLEASQTEIDPFSIKKLINQSAPDFEFMSNGSRKNLSSLQGSLIILHFWAKWSPSSLTEIHSLINLLKGSWSKKIRVIAITQDEEKSIDEFLKLNKINPDEIRDLYFTVDKSLTIHKLYRVYMIPTTFIINKNGIIVKIYEGERDWQNKTIINLIKSLSEEKTSININ